MTIDELNNITKLTNKRKIERALRAAGYFDCAKHEQLRHLSLLKLAYAEMEDGADLTANGKWLFDGQIIGRRYCRAIRICNHQYLPDAKRPRWLRDANGNTNLGARKEQDNVVTRMVLR